MQYKTFQKLKQDEHQYVMQSYARFDVAFVRGEGATLYDIEGNSYVDMTSGIGVCSLGYANPKLTEVIAKQAQNLLHVSNLFYTEPVVSLAKKLCTYSHFQNAFFANSGAEANECAIKIARKYSNQKYGADRNQIITLYHSFHGRTVTTLSATGQDKFHQYFFPFTEGFTYVHGGDLEELTTAADEQTCAVLLELVQGEGGVLPLDPIYVQAVAEFCRKKDLLLMVDEVQTGIGRTGKLFCFENYGIKPNVVTLAKGLGGGIPIGCVLADEKTKDVIGSGDHGTTFGGNPLACACGNAVIDEVATETFLQSVEKKGAYLRNRLVEIQHKTDKIQGIRGLGMMLGIVVGAENKQVLPKRFLEKGLLVLTAGSDTIRLLPPLTISDEELEKALTILEEVFCA